MSMAMGMFMRLFRKASGPSTPPPTGESLLINATDSLLINATDDLLIN